MPCLAHQASVVTFRHTQLEASAGQLNMGSRIWPAMPAVIDVWRVSTSGPRTNDIHQPSKVLPDRSTRAEWTRQFHGRERRPGSLPAERPLDRKLSARPRVTVAFRRTDSLDGKSRTCCELGPMPREITVTRARAHPIMLPLCMCQSISAAPQGPRLAPSKVEDHPACRLAANNDSTSDVRGTRQPIPSSKFCPPW